MSYYEIYKHVTAYRFDLSGILAGDYFIDPGWVLLCWLFKHIGGFFMMVAVLNLNPEYAGVSNHNELCGKEVVAIVCIYLFSTSFYLLNFSMMRQGFVVCVFL